ncbi:MAG: TetR/AcrR family transcriptional regulator [Proteobacteria bacterium]|nr:TetR/AcrR family transcriptional regulator [Pseudomonadota bacterium]
MSRTKSDAKRTAIVEAALRLFSDYGYRRTSVADVADAAGIAKGTVYLYFDNKESLFAGVCRHVVATFLTAAEAAVEADLAIDDKVRAILEAKFTYLYKLVHSSPHAGEIIQSKNDLTSEVFADADRRYERLLTAVLDAGKLDLEASGYTPQSAAELLIRCAHGNGTAGPSGNRPGVATYNRRLASMTRIVLTGLRGARPD